MSSTFVMLTRLSPESAHSPSALRFLEQQVARAAREACPTIEWVLNLALLGPYEYLDVFRAPSVEDAAKVAAVVRLAGHAQTEIWGAVEWDRFKDVVSHLPEEVGRSVLTH